MLHEIISPISHKHLTKKKLKLAKYQKNNSISVFKQFWINYSKNGGIHGIHYLSEKSLHWSERFDKVSEKVQNMKRN